MSARRAVVLALFFLAAAAGAVAQFLPYYGKNKVPYDVLEWRLYRSPHFDVLHDTGMERDLERVVDLAERAYDRLARELEHDVRFRIPLIVYRSHAEFEQTGVLDELIDEGIGGFAEPGLNRMVLPVEGTEEELRRLVTHELTHIFEFSMVYRGLRPQLLVHRPPQWAMEGFADFMSEDQDPLERMLLRDAVLHDRIPRTSELDFDALPTPVLGYKLGQAAFEAVNDRWGMAGVRRLWWGFRKNTLVGGVPPWKTAFDVDAREFDRTVELWLRKRFPIEGGRERAWAYERKVELEAPLDQPVALAASPSGEVLAVLARNRTTGELDLALVSAEDGKLLRNLTPGITTRWDYLTLDGRIAEGRSIAWDPGGGRIAVFARQGRRRALLVFDAGSGAVVARHVPPFENAGGPAFTPDGAKVVFAATVRDRTDLFAFDLATGSSRPLTDDAADDRTPAVGPGGTLVRVSRERGFGHLVRSALDGSGKERLTDGAWDDTSPWFDPDGNLYYVSDRGGAPNVWRIRAGAEVAERLTDVATGNFSPVLLASGGEPARRIAFLGYDDGEFSVYVNPEGEARETVPLASGERRTDPLPQTRHPALDPSALGRPRRGLHLTGLREIQAGVSSDGTLFGETSARLEDLLGERELLILARSVREFRSLYVRYGTRLGRSELAFEGYDLASYFFADPDLALAGRPEQASRLVRTRVSGGGVEWKRSFSLYRRVELGAGLERRDRDFRRDDVESQLLSDGAAVPIRGALVLETTRFLRFGPIAGRTYRLAATVAPRVGDLLGFHTLEVDARRYVQISRRALLALRAAGFYSGGHDPQYFAFGGEGTFRGADYNAFAGTRAFFGNAEVRFPLLDLVATPVLSLDDVRGTLFFDLAGAWRPGQRFRFATRDGAFRLADARATFGGGVALGFLGIPLHVDVSWPTDLDVVGNRRVSAWLGWDY